jgi:hypothetical protein
VAAALRRVHAAPRNAFKTKKGEKQAKEVKAKQDV